MGIFDQLLSDVVGGVVGSSGSSVTSSAQSLVGPLLGLFGNGGGLASMLGQLSANGLGQEVASWVGSGPNLPVSQAQMAQALPAGLTQQLAGQSGLAPDALHGALAQMLPQLVDHLTPQGQLPSPTTAMPDAATLLRQLFAT